MDREKEKHKKEEKKGKLKKGAKKQKKVKHGAQADSELLLLLLEDASRCMVGIDRVGGEW